MLRAAPHPIGFRRRILSKEADFDAGPFSKPAPPDYFRLTPTLLERLAILRLVVTLVTVPVAK